MTRPQRIVSLLPSATETLYALGLGDRLVAVTHECDYPPDALTKPKATYSLVAHETMTALEIDIAVRDALQTDGTLYDLDRQLLDSLRPDLIVTQELCDVCAVSFNRVRDAAAAIGGPRVVSLDPHHLRDVLDNILLVGRLTGAEERATALVEDAYRRIGRVAAVAAGIRRRPRVVLLEWLAPPYRAGHWMPEIVELAGGDEQLGRAGEDAAAVEWSAVMAAQPEVVIIAQCGFDLARSVHEARRVAWPDGWTDLPAVRDRQVFVVDGNAYLSRPGPRIVESLEVVAEILHPGHFAGFAPPGSYCRLEL
jgi:iron complex transport system substrate-binding protein